MVTRVFVRFWVRLLIRANILRFNGVVHSVLGDVPVDSEAPVVTSSISRICWPGLSEVFIGVGCGIE